MSFNGGLFFTNRGKALQAKAVAGTQLNFTRIGVGDGQLGSQDISDLTALIDEIKSLSITSIKVLTGGIAAIKGVLTNQGLATGFYFRELGLFATDPDLGEILYCYGNAGALAEYIPADSGAEILEKTIGINSIIGNATNITATINESLVYETPDGAQEKADAAQAAGVAAAATVQANLVAHKADTMPHRFVSDGVTYRWGLTIIGGVVNMTYEEVV